MRSLSIIVVTWNNEGFIEEALHSCILPDVPDLEVIVVHNRSTDHTGKVLRRVTDLRPDIFQVIDLADNLGPGLARNVGLERATGRQVLFLDGDDWFAPDLGRVLLPYLGASAPDVLVFNHDRVDDTGRHLPNATTHLLAARPCDTDTDRVAVMDNLNVPWNKLYRRDFVDRHRLRFSDGLYEDIDWHFYCLCLAKTYRVTPEVLVHYRQRPGSILRSTDTRHADVIARYRAVLGFLKSDPDRMRIFGAAAYRHAVRLIGNIVVLGNRVPKAALPRFMAEATALLRGWQALLPDAPTGLMARGLATGSRGAVLLANIWRKVGIKAAIWGPLIRRRLRRDAVALAYRAFCLLPVRPKLVVAEAYWGARVDCNPLALTQALARRGGYDIRWSLSAAGWDAPVPAGMGRVRRGSVAQAWALARAGIILTNANFPAPFTRRKGQVVVQTKHGTPVKAMGLDQRARNPGAMDWTAFARRCRQWTHVLSSNPYASAVWRRGFPYAYRMIEDGYPRNDTLFATDPAALRDLRHRLGVPDGLKVALYAPTTREGGALNPARDPLVFDPARVVDALGDDHVLLVRAHYFSPSAQTGPRVIDVSTYPHTADILRVTDLLITDYSSIMFDFACLLRPIVLYPFDHDVYRRDRGLYLEIGDLGAGPVAMTQNDLCAILRDRIYADPDHQKKLAQFAKTYCPWDDGGAADRVLDAILGLGTDGT
jgi:CDP-glycerol glycerophosphotransferase